MREQPAAPTDKRHRFPAEIIARAVWLYFRFAPSYLDVEELLAARRARERRGNLRFAQDEDRSGALQPHAAVSLQTV